MRKDLVQLKERTVVNVENKIILRKSCGKQQQQKQQKRERRPKKRNETPKPVNPLKSKDNDSDTSSEDYLYTVKNKKTPSVRMKVCKHLFDATIDTGATINVIDQTTYSKMDRVNLKQTNIKAFAYNATEPVEFQGKFEAVIETRKRIAVAKFYVAQTSNSGNLISATTAQDLGLISLHVNKLTESKDAKIDEILSKHAKVFSGLGKLKGEQVKLNIDQHQPPKTQPQRRIPYHIREKVQAALEELEKSDIIEWVPEIQPTPWVSPIVAVPKKDGGVRICVDMRQANDAIKRVRHLIPTVKDISLELNGAQWFSKLDLSPTGAR